MVQINPLVLMLLTEAVGILVIALAVVGILGLRRIARDKRGIRGLISNANSQAAVRKETLSGVITAREGLEGDALEARVGEILAAERLFLQNFIRVYRRRNAAEVSKMCAAVSGLVAPYLSVEVAVAATSSVVPPVGAAAPETNDYSPAGANGEGLVDCGGAPADTEAPGMIDDLIMVADDDAMQDRLAGLFDRPSTAPPKYGDDIEVVEDQRSIEDPLSELLRQKPMADDEPIGVSDEALSIDEK